MATWLAHLRIADKLLDEFDLNETDFFVGNIAPDCGEPAAGGFDPPKEVTHWTNSGKAHCEYERFYREMISGRTLDRRTRDFLLGYYCHLMADVLWSERINAPCKQKHHALYSSDREEYYRRVKPEWYANDHLYLKQHPDDWAFHVLSSIEHYPVTCLPYYKPDNVEKQLRHIRQFYLNPPEYGTDFHYLTPEMMDEWVIQAANVISERLACRI